MARYYNQYSYLDYLSFPIHLWFVVGILFFILGFTWYINYESLFEDLINQIKLFCMILPILILLIVYCLSTGGLPFLVPLPERDSLHRAGGSPWGVALLLVFLFFMISYKSSFHDRWFPFISK
ncbi:hypothetical protein I3843_13G150000 [Carya illinoinensis]|uniref:Uncharacterized protein n=1 Tax=Carya illinoinensis TaxID=32201 RepID=A0A8T1NTV0_CARIL|nr:hypothetical protein I3760_13G170500 [Carya illinoinensis]KAG6632624.1 hypothetical protein CIPAW_13G172000 [Carya illinoinensis]KAG6683012.1 hypothetical protein I3842_13G171200 [Carya illinoinensis]KAG7951105.1 hypothetical protein I3843_13G150000 [Carya illinoinensis]